MDLMNQLYYYIQVSLGITMGNPWDDCRRLLDTIINRLYVRLLSRYILIAYSMIPSITLIEKNRLK